MMASEQGTSNIASSATLSATPTINQTNSDTLRNRSLKRGRSDYSHDSLSIIANAGLVGLPSPKSPRFHGKFSPKFTSGNLTMSDRFREEIPKNKPLEKSENSANEILSPLLPNCGSTRSKSQDAPIVTISMSKEITAVGNAMNFDEKPETSPTSSTSATSNSTVVTASIMTSGDLEQENRDVRIRNIGQRVPLDNLLPRPSAAFSENVVAQQSQDKNAVQEINLPIPSPQATSRLLTQKKHECPYCETEFTRYHNLKSHLLTHSQEKPYVCQTCTMRFRRLHDLKRHTKLHTGERPHICRKCDRKFARGDALARHTKGQGGCAGRRLSIGSFGGDDEIEDSNTGDGNEIALNSYIHGNGKTNPKENEVSEGERGKSNFPSIQAQHIGCSGSGDNFASSHSPNTYPPARSRTRQSSGTIHPLPGARGGSGYPSNPSHAQETVLRGYNPSINLSTIGTKAEASSVFPQSAIPETPKPLTTAGTQPLGHDSLSIIRPRSPSLPAEFQQHYGRRQPNNPSTSGTSPSSSHGPKLPALTGLAPLDQRFTLSSQVSGQPSPGICQQATAISPPSTVFSPAAQTPTTDQNQSSVDNNNNPNLFASGEKGVWAYVQTLEERVKLLSDKVQAMETKKRSQEDKINQLSVEVFSLRSQLNAPTQSPYPSGAGQS